MIIQNSQVSLASRQLSMVSYQKTESLKVWVGNKRPDFEGKGAAQGGAEQGRAEQGGTADKVRLTVQTAAAAAAASEAKKSDAAGAAETDMDPKYLLLKMLVEMLLHTKITLISPGQMQAAAPATPPAAGDASEPLPR